jgi:DNA transformation protein and related proteins
MAVSSEYKAFVLDVLEPLGEVRIRAMFGGAGVYHRDLMFGLIANETLHFKADEVNRPAFEEESMGPFVYEPPSGKQIAMSYWELPERLYDEPEELLNWAKAAIEAASRAKKSKPKSRKKAQPKKGGANKKGR